jgi:hypothetical protein
LDVQTRSHLSGEPSPESDDTQAVRIARAESLLRTIVGIADVRVVPHPAGGIAVVRVDCGDEASPGQVLRNIRSALLAGLGISISPECVDFVLPNELADTTVKPAVAPVPVAGNTPVKKEAVSGDAGRAPSLTLPPTSATPRTEIAVRPVTAAEHSAVHTFAAKKTVAPRIAPVETASDAALRQAVTATTTAPAEPRVAGSVGRGVRDIVASAAALKLESVELRRQSGRLRCRVVVSLGTDHFGAVADSSDPHAEEIHLTGRVTCDALRAGGFTEARFDGATIAEINGREHVVIAMSEWSGGETMVLSGAAPLEETPERAAAIAAIKAVLAQDIN